MNIFNSLGSNYNWTFILKTLFAKSNEVYKSDLVKFLEKKYEGKAILVYKGREAIGLALEILNFPKQKLHVPCHPERSEGSPSKRFFGFQPQNDRNYVSVAINSFTCYAVYKAIENAGYEPLCLDLPNNLDLNFSANELLKSIKQNPKIKVVIIQNTLGYPCDIEGIAKICRENNLILIEDLAHCVGTQYKKGKETGSPRCEAGTIGDFVVLSFSQDKIIDSISGGALIIRNKKYQDYYSSSEVSDSERSREVNNGTIKQLNNDRSRPASRQGGQARTINLETLGLKQQLIDRLYPLLTYKIRKTYKIGVGKLLHFILKKLKLLPQPMGENFYAKYDLPNWYSYLCLKNFKNLNKNLEHRRKIAATYNSMLDKKITSKIIGQNIQLSSNLRFPIFVDNRKALIAYLKKQGVYVSDIWYDSVDNNLKNTKEAAHKILNLPTHINISEEDAKNISLKINQWLQ